MHAYHCDDIVIWPDGNWATLGDVRTGDYDSMSDDYEIARLEDLDRLAALGLDQELGIT